MPRGGSRHPRTRARAAHRAAGAAELARELRDLGLGLEALSVLQDDGDRRTVSGRLPGLRKRAARELKEPGPSRCALCQSPTFLWFGPYGPFIACTRDKCSFKAPASFGACPREGCGGTLVLKSRASGQWIEERKTQVKSISFIGCFNWRAKKCRVERFEWELEPINPNPHLAPAEKEPNEFYYWAITQDPEKPQYPGPWAPASNEKKSPQLFRGGGLSRQVKGV